MMKHSLFSPFCILFNLLSPIVLGLWWRITMFLERKLHCILGTLLFLENAIIVL